MTARDFLQRFRPAGAPGPAAGAGVPADRMTEASTELAPVLALLADVEAEATRIRREAAALAQARRVAAAEAATRILADAGARAEEARAEAFAVARANAEAAGVATLAAAREEATRIRRNAEGRLPGLAARAGDLALPADLSSTLDPELFTSHPERSGIGV